MNDNILDYPNLQTFSIKDNFAKKECEFTTKLKILKNCYAISTNSTRRKVTEVASKTAENVLYESNAVAKSPSLKS